MTDSQQEVLQPLLSWRNVGPHRGGRVSAVAGDYNDPLTFYFGAGAGGVWKSTNAGITWQNVSDGFFETASVGAIAVSPIDSNVVLVGMGEANVRATASYGNGVYRSQDAGRTWKHLGLEDTRHISRIRVHPRNDNIFYVAALGHAFGPNEDRGVFRTTDGGESFEKILYVDADTGAIDLSMDPLNPRILFAAMWQMRRTPHSLTSGGPGSGLYRSDDGGDTWELLSDRPGFPEGELGRMGVAVSAAGSDRVYCLVEAKDRGMYRTDDGGRTWKQLSKDPSFTQRSWYYTHVIADPVDPNAVYALNTFVWKSTDGGSNYENVPTPHPDNHDLWIDPNNPNRMIEGNDGGATVTLDGGSSWSTVYNQPTGEFYHTATSNEFPYRIFSAQQDNTTISLPSRTLFTNINQRDWYQVGGAESGHIAVRDDAPHIVYAGSSGGGEGGRLDRYNHLTGERRNISVLPERTAMTAAQDYKYRFQWTSPLMISPHDQNVLYSAGNHVFRSRDEGDNWEVISPDLTRDDTDKLGPSGGELTMENLGTEVYCVIFALAESSVQKGLLWAGSNDGLIHVSRDDGATWENVSPSLAVLPEWAIISTIEASRHDPAVAYVAAIRHKLDDQAPYLLRTRDFGQSWELIVDGIRGNDYTRVVREDPGREGLLFAGTETGMYVSWDYGDHWLSLQLNLPVVPVHDIDLRDDDLVVATHGRAFWILDDYTPLRQWNGGEPPADGLFLFDPRDTVIYRSISFLLIPQQDKLNQPLQAIDLPRGDTYWVSVLADEDQAAEFLDAGQNAPEGVAIRYHVPEGFDGPVTLDIRDSDGMVVRSYTSEKVEGQPEPRLSSNAGYHKVVWNFKYEPAVEAKGVTSDMMRAAFGCNPIAAPGKYSAVLKADDSSTEAEFTLLRPMAAEATDTELLVRTQFMLKIRDLMSLTSTMINWLRTSRTRVEGVLELLSDDQKELEASLKGLIADIEEVAEVLNKRGLAEPLGGLVEPREMYSTPKLIDQIAYLHGTVASAHTAPTATVKARFAELGDLGKKSLEQVRNVREKAATLLGADGIAMLSVIEEPDLHKYLEALNGSL